MANGRTRDETLPWQVGSALKSRDQPRRVPVHLFIGCQRGKIPGIGVSRGTELPWGTELPGVGPIEADVVRLLSLRARSDGPRDQTDGQHSKKYPIHTIPPLRERHRAN